MLVANSLQLDSADQSGGFYNSYGTVALEIMAIIVLALGLRPRVSGLL